MGEFEEELGEKLERMRHGIQLLARQTASVADPDAHVDDTVEELRVALEELEVVQEELLRVNEELVDTRVAVEREAERYRALFELAPDPYLITDTSGVILEANAAVGRLFCMEARHLTGKPLVVFVAPDDRTGFHRQLDRLAAFPPGQRLDGWVVHLSPRHASSLEVMINVTRGGPREPRQVLRWMLRDLTSQREIEARLRQAQQLEAVGRLAGGVAHDFNNLLMVIDGHCMLADRVLPPDSPSKPHLAVISDTTRRAAALVAQLLAFARRQPTREEVIAVDEVVEELARTLRRVLGDHIELRVANDGSARPVRMDRSQLGQVIMNLAVNARDAMPRGGKLTMGTRVLIVPPGAHPEAPEGGRYVQIYVSDTGHGIPEDVLPHVFEPFFTTKPTGEGTGLGLSTVHGIVSQAGGFVDVATDSHGTTFYVHLPMTLDAPDAPPDHHAIEPGHGETLLLVEDDAEVREVLRLLLTALGYVVHDAPSGSDAETLFALDGDRIAAVVSDVSMPGMSGPELVERLRKQRPGLPALFVSARPTEASEADGPTGVLGKPFDEVQLGRALRHLLDR